MIDKDLLRLLRGNKKCLLETVLLMLLGMLANIGITACICAVIHRLLQGAALAKSLTPLLPAALCAAARYAATRWVGETRDRLGGTIKKELREKTYEKIVRLGVRSTDEMSMAGLTQVALEGIEQLDLYFSSYIPQFFYAMIAPFLLFFICVPIDGRVAAVLLACVPLIPVSIIAVSRYAKKIFAKYWGKYTSMGDKFLDSVQGLRELKIFRADERAHARMNENAEEFRKITMKVLVMQLASTTIMDLVAYGGAGLGIAFAVSGVVRNGLSPVHALFLTLVAVEFFLPLRAFGSAFHVAMNGVSAGKKILALLDAPEPVWGTESPAFGHCDCQQDAITLQNVTFSYDHERDVLKNVTMHFPQRGMTAIAGESGCGKSTVVRLLDGAYKPNQGQVTVCGTPLDRLSREAYYAHLAVVSCNTYVFNQSVRENFQLAKGDVTDEEIMRALARVNLDAFIRENGGLDKQITEDGANLSGGQKQRLALAISLVADKDVYVFDEATSNIDIESERMIMDNIALLAKEKTVIVISHRLENIVHADHIYYLENGQVRESGTHEDLLRHEGGYARLYLTQKALENGQEAMV